MYEQSCGSSEFESVILLLTSKKKIQASYQRGADWESTSDPYRRNQSDYAG